MDEVETVWARMTRRAVEGLEALPDIPGLIPSFRLRRYAPGKLYQTWTLWVSRPFGGSDPPGLLRSMAWSAGDAREGLNVSLRRRPRLDPVLIRRDRAVRWEDVEEPLTSVRTLKIPSTRVVRPFLVDERSEYGIEGYREGAFRIEWDTPVPLDLEAVAAWAGRCWDLFERLGPA